MGDPRLDKASGDVGVWQIVSYQLGFANGPDFEEEENPMAEQAQQWPRTLFSKDEQQNPVTDSVTGEVLCGSRAFTLAGRRSMRRVATPCGMRRPSRPPKPRSASRSANQAAPAGPQPPTTGRQPQPPQPERDPRRGRRGGVATPSVPRRR